VDDVEKRKFLTLPGLEIRTLGIYSEMVPATGYRVDIEMIMIQKL
jgi:hypothetical protein